MNYCEPNIPNLPPNDRMGKSYHASGPHEPTSRWQITLLICILLIGIILRGMYLYEAVQSPMYAAPPVDPGYHVYWARALVSGDWTPPSMYADPHIPTTPFFRPPGYAYFLATIFVIFGTGGLAPLVVQMILGMINAYLLYRLTKRHYGQIEGMTAAALMSTYWIFIYYEGAYQEPSLLIFFLLSFLMMIARASERFRFLEFLASGALLGLASLVKPNPLLFLPVGMAWTWWIAYCRRAPLYAYFSALGVFLGCMLMILPATIRNYLVAGDRVLISSNLGINLLIGNNERADGLYNQNIPGAGVFLTCYEYPEIVARVERKLGRSLLYSEVSTYFAGQALDYVLSYPGHAARLLLRKAALFWAPYEISHSTVIDVDRRHSAVLRNIPGNFSLLASLFVLGLIHAVYVRNTTVSRVYTQRFYRRRLEISILLLAFILIFFLSYLPFFNTALYRVPLLPLLIVFASVGLSSVASAIHNRRFASALGRCAIVVGLYFGATRPLIHYDSPGLANWHLLRARCWSESGRLERAVDETRAALSVEPDHLDAHLLQASLLRKIGRAAEAQRVERRIPRLREQHADRSLALAASLAQRGRLDDALCVIDEARRTAPSYFAVYSLASEILAASNRVEEATAYARQAVKHAPESLRDRCRLGNLLLRRGRPKEAECEFREALRRDPNLQPAQDGLMRAIELQAGSANKP